MKPITIVMIGNSDNDLIRFSIEKTTKTIDCEHVITFTSEKISNDYQHIPVISDFTYYDYNYFCLKNLWAFIQTDYVLIIHPDGMAVNSQYWTDEYLNYDYIGAPWPEKYSWIYPEERVGNGGFTLRSRKLLYAIRDDQVRIIKGSDRTENEDAVICQNFGQYLKHKHQIKFAPVELANVFSHELSNFTGETLGFHGAWNAPLYFEEDEVEFMIQHLKKQYWNEDRLGMFFDNCKKVNYNKVPLVVLNKIS